MQLTVTPGTPLRGDIRVAADKSISHRAVMLAAIARGRSRLTNLLEGEDVLATIGAFRRLGVSISRLAAGEYSVDGVGLHGLRAPDSALDMGNSGTAMRLLAGLLCGQKFASVLTGDSSLRGRPMGRIIAPLREMGAQISAADDKPPLHISPTYLLRGIAYQTPVASAQVKSCLLLAGLYAEGGISLAEATPTRDHTERMLAAVGYPIATENGRISLPPSARHLLGGCLLTGEETVGGEWQGFDLTVPADLSSAAFFLVGASVIPGSEIRLPGVGVNPSRDGVINILRKMGADISAQNRREVGGEPVADLRVRHAELRGCEIGGEEVASAIDEIPAIAVAAACAKGVTVIRGAAELRVKESDRIAAVAAGLSALGVAVTEHDDGLTIVGGGGTDGNGNRNRTGDGNRTGGNLSGGIVDSHGDHRIAMAFAIAGGVATAPVTIRNCDNIATSFPDFQQVAAAAGLKIHAE